jgi:hypothetical protein
MKTLLAVLVAALPLMAADNTLTSKEVSQGWLLLFDGETLHGWSPEVGAKWKADNGLLVSDGGEYGWLRTNTQFSDFILKLEFQTAPDGNSGVFLRSKKGRDAHVTGYELQIYDGHKEYPTGGILNHAKPQRKSEIKQGKWHSYEIFCLGTQTLIKLDGKKTAGMTDSKSLAGYIGLQYNKDKPVAFRNIKIQPLGLAPIFNGKNLSGWQEVQPPRAPKEPAVWSVKKGLLHVEKGPGHLETKALYDDFVLQLEIKTNPKDANHHPNSGIFLRGKPNGYWTGYEIQIRNEYKNNDRTQAVDTGSGGIYFHQPARRVVSNDGEFYVQTVIAQGRHLATWVNGYPVASWDDPYPEGDAGPRQKQALLKAGPISLQAHDPTTNLDFRNIRIKSLGKN